MPLILVDRTIQRIYVVDDDPSVRASYGEFIQDLDAEAIAEAGPLPDVEAFRQVMAARAEAALCDHHLKAKGYAGFNGADLVASCYQSKFPALLCTRWEGAIEEMRPQRKYIPVLLDPHEIEPGNIKRGIEICIEEFQARFSPSRRAWRTLVRIEEVQANVLVYVVIPSWDTQKVVKLKYDSLPRHIWPITTPGMRLHAHVNIGAESIGDLYFDEWEPE